MNKNETKENLLFIFMCILCILAFTGCLGAINYSITNGIIYAIGGIAGIITSIYAVIKAHKRFDENT